MNKKLFVAMLLIAVLLVCTLTACAQTCVNGHGWKDGAIIKEATCTEVGKFTQKCADCSATREVAIKALGHSFGNWTANEDGLTHSRVCANDNTHIETVTHIDADGNQICDDCNFVLAPAECSHVWGDWADNGDGTCSRICANDNTHVESGAHIDADENEICDNCEANLHVHNHVEVAREEADCENDGAITLQCDCGDSYKVTIPATGHDWSPWAPEEGNKGSSTRVCANEASHKETVKFFGGTTVDVAKGSLLVFHVDSTKLGEYSDIKVEFSKPVYNADNATVNPGVFKENKVTVVDTYSGMNGNAYKYPYYDMVASEMGVPVTATLYGDGQLLAIKTYSITTYAYNIIRNEVIPKELKTFMVDMLNYGAASQINFYYQSANLANADLTEEEKALGTQEVPELNNIYEIVEATDGSGINPKAVAVSLGSVIETNLFFTLGENDKNDIEVVIDYFTFKGEPAQMIIDGCEIQQLVPGVDRYNVVFAEYGPSQVRDALYMSFRSKATGEKIGGTLTYSIESYIANCLTDPELKAETRELLIVIMKYAVSAEAYFATR